MKLAGAGWRWQESARREGRLSIKSPLARLIGWGTDYFAGAHTESGSVNWYPNLPFTVLSSNQIN